MSAYLEEMSHYPRGLTLCQGSLLQYLLIRLGTASWNVEPCIPVTHPYQGTMERIRSRLPRLPAIKKCFCLPLHTGILIFGYFNLILSGVVLPKMCSRLLEQLFTNETLLVDLPPECLIDAGHSGPGDDLAMDSIHHHAVAFLWITIDIVLSIILLTATHLYKSGLMKVYLGLGTALQVLSFGSDIALYEFGDHYDNFVYFFFIGLNVFLLYMVYSYLYPNPYPGGGETVTGVRYKTQEDDPLDA